MACVADRGPLLDRQAAIRARLNELGVPIEGETTAHPIGPPQFVPDQYGGRYEYVGKDATVSLNKDGQVVTAWANSRSGWRNP